MRAIITLLSALISFQSMAQEIAGKVIDEKREPMIRAVVQVYTGGILKGGTVTDYDGNYVIKPLEPGYYDALAIYIGYDSVFTNKILVSPEQRTTVNFALTKINGQPKIIIKEYKKPLVDVDGPVMRGCGIEIGKIPIYIGTDTSVKCCHSVATKYIIDSVQLIHGLKSVNQMRSIGYQSHFTFTREDIIQMPITSIADIVSLVPGAYQQRRGDDIHFYGSH